MIMGKEDRHVYESHCLNAAGTRTAAGKLMPPGIAVPSAPFLTSRTPQDVDHHLSSIPSIALPESIVSKSFDGLTHGDGHCVSYGSLRSSSFQSRWRHGRNEKSPPHTDAPTWTTTTGSVPRISASESCTISSPTQQQRVSISQTRPVSGQSHRYLPLQNCFNNGYNQTEMERYASIPPIINEECKKSDTSIPQDPALEGVCEQLSGIAIDKKENENHDNGELDNDLPFGQSLTALGVMEFTRARTRNELQYSCDKKLAQSLREDLMLIALRQWASRSYVEEDRPGSVLSFQRVNSRECGAASSSIDLRSPVEIKSRAFVQNHDVSSCCSENGETNYGGGGDESCGEDVEESSPDTFEHFEFELE